MIIKINKYISRPALAFINAERAHTSLICLSNYLISIILIAFDVNKTFGWLYDEEVRCDGRSLRCSTGKFEHILFWAG